MRLSRWYLLLLVLFLASLYFLFGCGPIPPGPPPKPPVAFDLAVCRNAPANNYCDGMPTSITVVGLPAIQTDGNGYVFVQNVPATLTTADITFHATGYLDKHVVVPVGALTQANAAGRHNFYELSPDLKPFPPIVTNADRAYRLDTCYTFSGLIVNGTEYGDLPMFEPAGTFLGPTGRRAWFDAKHASPVCGPGGDTHATIWFADTVHSVYDESGQPFQQIQTKDWTQDPAGFREVVKEVLWDGFVPEVFFDGDTLGPVNGLRAWTEAHAILTSDPDYGDLSQYVVYDYCYDSCFYGNTDPGQFKVLGDSIKQACPTCLLITEMQTGHIPVGQGLRDWTPGGNMWSWDGMSVEFDTNIHEDSTWQVLGRLLGPRYRRPSDQPSGDDPTPPNYFAAGQWATCRESGLTYAWVRTDVHNAAAVSAFMAQRDAQHTYLSAIGCGHAYN